MPRILGREPALWLALFASAVKLLAAFGLNLSVDQQAVLNAAAAALVGVIVAFVARDALFAPILGALQAVVALAVGFGLNWSSDQQAIVMTAAAAVVAMFTRTQATAPVPAAEVSAPAAGKAGVIGG